jgi:hypothetical protein
MTRPGADGAVARDDYTWTHAVQNVALLWPIEQQGRLHPHDAMRSLLLLFDDDAGYGARGRALADLIEQGSALRK